LRTALCLRFVFLTASIIIFTGFVRCHSSSN
jgi:hypothetical protein